MKSHRVLVVEDDADIREALIDALMLNGCEATGAANGALALEHLAKTDPLPCLILLDLMMPVMDGEMFREVQLATPRIAHIPVVVISAYRDAERSGERLRAAAFLRKPPKMEDVMNAVGRHC